MKRLLLILLTISLLVLPASATETEETAYPQREPGYCGEDLKWFFDADTGVLTISGNGQMDDFPEGGAPWQEFREEVTGLVLDGQISYIGANAFGDFDELTAVDFGSALRELGARSFYSCDGLTELRMPASFKIFGEESLRNCTLLKQIHCAGGFPSFRLNCLWDTWVDILYPAERPWSESLIEELEGAFHGRIRFLASDGTDPYEKPEETTEEPTEATTEAATEPVAEPATEAATAPATEPPTEEVTQEPTEAETAPQTTGEYIDWATTEPTQWITEPQEEEAPRQSKSWIGLAIVGLTVSALGIGALVFARPRKPKGRGKYSR